MLLMGDDLRHQDGDLYEANFMIAAKSVSRKLLLTGLNGGAFGKVDVGMDEARLQVARQVRFVNWDVEWVVDGHLQAHHQRMVQVWHNQAS